MKNLLVVLVVLSFIGAGGYGAYLYVDGQGGGRMDPRS